MRRLLLALPALCLALPAAAADMSLLSYDGPDRMARIVAARLALTG